MTGDIAAVVLRGCGVVEEPGQKLKSRSLARCLLITFYLETTL